jgi:hypothetical protein
MAPVQYLPRQAGERQRLVQGLGAEAGVTGARFAPVRCGVPRLPSRAAAIKGVAENQKSESTGSNPRNRGNVSIWV